MSILEASRALGAEIQKDERFIRYAKARLANDNDKQLQDGIGEFNVVRMNLDNEMANETRDEEKIKELNEKLRKIYSELMSSSAMIEYNTAKAEMDSLLADVNSVIIQCVEGADPQPANRNSTAVRAAVKAAAGATDIIYRRMLN